MVCDWISENAEQETVSPSSAANKSLLAIADRLRKVYPPFLIISSSEIINSPAGMFCISSEGVGSKKRIAPPPPEYSHVSLPSLEVFVVQTYSR